VGGEQLEGGGVSRSSMQSAQRLSFLCSAADISSAFLESALDWDSLTSTFTVRINNARVLGCVVVLVIVMVVGLCMFVHFVVAACVCGWFDCNLLPNENTSIVEICPTYAPPSKLTMDSPRMSEPPRAQSKKLGCQNGGLCSAAPPGLPVYQPLSR